MKRFLTVALLALAGLFSPANAIDNGPLYEILNAGGGNVNPSFNLPLQTSLIPERSNGSSTPTYTRATTAYQTDHEGKLNLVPSGAARFQGARYVKNYFTATENFTGGAWSSNGGGTIGAGTFTFAAPANDGLQQAVSVPAGSTVVLSATLWTNSGTKTVRFRAGSYSSDITVTTTPTRYSAVLDGSSTVSGIFNGSAGGTGLVNISWPQYELVTGQTNQNPSEYVSVGVLSAPYHGAGVDGVKYFQTLNGNTVASNVVTEATGAAINSSNAKFGVLPGVAGDGYSTPNAAANRITGDIDIRVHAQAPDWTPSVLRALISKWTHPNQSYNVFLNTNGTLRFDSSVDGNVSIISASTAPTGITDGTAKWLRVTCDVDNGAGGNTVTFYLSDDGVTWTALGAPVVNAGTTAIYAGNQPLYVGAYGAGTYTWNGNIYRAQIYNGINGTLAVDFNPNLSTSAQTFTAATGEVWTTNGTARIFGNTHATYGIPAQWDASGPYGYYSEGVRENKVLQSADLTSAADWNVGATTVTANIYTAPDGTTTMDRINISAGNAQHYVFQAALSVTTGAAYTTSAYLRYVNNRWAVIQFSDGTTNFGASFDLLNGAVGALAAGTTSTLTPTALAGVYRVTVTATSGATAAGNIAIAANTSDSATIQTWSAAGTELIGAWGFGLEAASFASSPITTTTIAVQRPQDLLTYLVAGNVSNTVGTAYAEISTLWATNGPSGGHIVSLTDATGTALYIAASQAATTITMNDGVNNPNKTGLSSAFTGVVKRASSWGSSGLAITGDGASPTTSAFDGHLGAGTGSFGVGISPIPSNPLFGTIRGVKIYPTALTASRLQAMTTP